MSINQPFLLDLKWTPRADLKNLYQWSPVLVHIPQIAFTYSSCYSQFVLTKHMRQQNYLYLNKNCHKRLIRIGEPLVWPAWSPNLNSLDFFLCSWLKSAAYNSGQLEIMQHLEDCITDNATSIRNEMEYIQQKHSVKWHLPACMQSQGTAVYHELDLDKIVLSSY